LLLSKRPVEGKPSHSLQPVAAVREPAAPQYLVAALPGSSTACMTHQVRPPLQDLTDAPAPER
jgi:hypothetical protein